MTGKPRPMGIGILFVTFLPGNGNGEDEDELNFEVYTGRLMIDGCWVYALDERLVFPMHRVLEIEWTDA